MSTTVKNITVSCTPIYENHTFTSGDYVSGDITLELGKDCQIDSLSVKFKGKAEVQWSEKHGKSTVVYHSKDKYFSIKQFFIREEKEQGEDQQTLLTDQTGKAYSNIVAPGCHVYPFTFQFPAQEMPSSFEGAVGKILYTLEARLSRSMRMASKASTKLNFVSGADMSSLPGLMAPQYGTKEKKMKFFTSGTVTMNVSLERMGYHQGEGIKVVAVIHNNSSREIKPKYCVFGMHSFSVRANRKLSIKHMIKEVGEPIPASTNQTVTRIINIPPDMTPSILNCANIKAEYRLGVYLDVKYASNPEVMFPLVILPARHAPAVQHPPAYSGFSFGASANPNQPAWNHPPMASQTVEPPPSYGAHEMYPSQSDFGGKY